MPLRFASQLGGALSPTDGDHRLCIRLLMTMDFDAVAGEVYGLASSSEDIAGPVREAVKVIEDALDSYGYVWRVILCLLRRYGSWI